MNCPNTWSQHELEEGCSTDKQTSHYPRNGVTSLGLPHWNEYKLEDGTTLKVKLVLRGVKRLARYEPDGTPVYVINSMNVVRAIGVPAEIKAKPKKREMNPV